MKAFLQTFASPLITGVIVIAGLFYVEKVIVPQLNNPAHNVVNVQGEANKYGKEMLTWYGNNAIAAAASVRSGKTLDESSKAFSAANSASMKTSFESHFRPTLTAILPEGSEPSTPDHRESMARFFEQLGAGVKGVAK